MKKLLLLVLLLGSTSLYAEKNPPVGRYQLLNLKYSFLSEEANGMSEDFGLFLLDTKTGVVKKFIAVINTDGILKQGFVEISTNGIK